MTELFPNISDNLRKCAEIVADLAFRQDSPAKAVKLMNQFTNACFSEEERNFCEFYFNMRMEQMLNER